MKQKLPFYAIYSKNDKFLHGVFPKTKEGLQLAKKYIKTNLSESKKSSFYIK
jgi:hypothetical protein